MLGQSDVDPIEEANATARAYPSDRCVHELIAEQAARTPTAVAVAFEGHTLTYGELESRAERLARYLRRLGVEPGWLVGVYMERSLELVVALLGTWKAGAAYVPLDPNYPRERIGFMVEDAAVRVLLTQHRLESSLPPHRAQIVRVDADWEQIERVGGPATTNVGSRDLAYVIYTSGSTGAPKGVQVEHRAVVNFLWSMRAAPGIRSDDVLLAVTSLSFDIAGLELYLPLVSGAKVVLLPGDVVGDGDALLRALRQSGATVLQATPSTWRMLLEAGYDGAPRLKMLCGGEAMPRDVADRLLATGGELWNMYGPTETTIWSTVHRLSAGERTIPIGRPIANTRVLMLGADGQRLPPGEAGELYIGGDGLARGYLGRAQLTAERFIEDRDGAGLLYRTGDLARWLPDGTLECLGRIDHQIKIRGFRIEPGEIEAQLGAHPAVRQSVVVAREDTPGDRRLVAYVVPRGAPPAADVLRAHLTQTLPEYMMPGFVTLDALPLTPNGKIDRRALPAPDWARGQAPYAAPRTPLEEVLTGIFAEVLRLERVGIHDDFFALGGNSLLATLLMTRLRAALPIELGLRVLFDAPTPAGLAALAQDADCGLAAPRPRLARLRGEGDTAVSLVQEKVLRQAGARYPDGHFQITFRLVGELRDEALERALAEIAVRHETLRTCLPLVDGTRVARVLPPCFRLERVDLRERADPAQAALIAAEETATRRFDLGSEPAYRACLYRTAPDEHLLSCVVHHLFFDQTSANLFTEELTRLYCAEIEGKPSPLPDLSYQYNDYVRWQRQTVDEAALAKQTAFFSGRVFAGAAPVHLPKDPACGAVLRPGKQTIRLSEELSRAVTSFSRRRHRTEFMTLLAAHAALVRRVTGARDFNILTIIDGRAPGLFDNLGFFTNLLPLRMRMAEPDDPLTIIDGVRDALLEAYEFSPIPFQLPPGTSFVGLLVNVLPGDSAEHAVLTLPGLTISRLLADTRLDERFFNPRTDLKLTLQRAGSRLEAVFETPTALWPDATLATFARQYEESLRAMIGAA